MDSSEQNLSERNKRDLDGISAKCCMSPQCTKEVLLFVPINELSEAF